MDIALVPEQIEPIDYFLDDGHIPKPSFTTLYTLSWKKLESLTEEAKETLAIDTFLKTINTRKGQYKTCQFCGDKVPAEHRFNAKTFQGCASEHFHVGLLDVLKKD